MEGRRSFEGVLWMEEVDGGMDGWRGVELMWYGCG